VLAYGAEESEKLGHKVIGTEHLLLGVLREKNCFAAEILKERGVKLDTVRVELANVPQDAETRGSVESGPINPLTRDIAQEAWDGKLEPVVGREQELAGVIEVLCSLGKRNPLLIGEAGVGKTAIIEALAQRIADGKVPALLADRRIVAFDAHLLAGSDNNRQGFEDLLNRILKSPGNSSEPIVFIEDLRVFGTTARSITVEAATFLKSALAKGEIQCIGASTPGGFATAMQAAPWLVDYFRSVHVRALDEERTLNVLQVRRLRYESYHGITYSNDALECAARGSSRYLPESSLPGKALELLDAAGSRVKLRKGTPPTEIAEVLKRLRFIDNRMETAITNHEFEKARFYSDEQRKEKENLSALREKCKTDDPASEIVSREDVEAVISDWAGYPFQP
jgi:ATP-dependent Clp protease ATP-binding subunit ClpC